MGSVFNLQFKRYNTFIPMERILHFSKKLIPKSLFRLLQAPYHYLLALLGAIRYRFPARKLTVIAVTGTKGKTTVVELIAAILVADGKKVASASTIQFRLNERVSRNLYKMTMPGRFFLQRFLSQAVAAGCTHAVVEMTSEGAKQFRHKFIALDALVFTNLTPEHIESHGSFSAYKEAKLKIARALEASAKRPRYIVANTDDEHGADFLNTKVEHQLPYSLSDLELHSEHKDSVSLVLEGTTIRLPMAGLFNVYNALAAITLTKALGVPLAVIERALENLEPVRGRVEQIPSPQGAPKNLVAVVDYAHTLNSLEELYKAFPKVTKIAVLGKCGGGRDRWSAPQMATLAESYCEHIFLTDEDPYDDNPEEIVEHMATGIKDKNKLTIIMDRREAIRAALEYAPEGAYVLISGKGTDPYIMRADGQKEPWSDAEVVREELSAMTNK